MLGMLLGTSDVLIHLTFCELSIIIIIIIILLLLSFCIWRNWGKESLANFLRHIIQKQLHLGLDPAP